MIDKSKLIDMYEKMRMTVMQYSKVKGRQSFGQVVLEKRGMVAWANACNKLGFCTPTSRSPLEPRTQTRHTIDVNDEMRNVLTSMALKWVEGWAHVNVNRI